MPELTEERRDQLKKAFPTLTDEEIEEADRNLREYTKVVIQIITRNLETPEGRAKLDAALSASRAESVRHLTEVRREMFSEGESAMTEGEKSPSD